MCYMVIMLRVNAKRHIRDICKTFIGTFISNILAPRYRIVRRTQCFSCNSNVPNCNSHFGKVCNCIDIGKYGKKNKHKQLFTHIDSFAKRSRSCYFLLFVNRV